MDFERVSAMCHACDEALLLSLGQDRRKLCLLEHSDRMSVCFQCTLHGSACMRDTRISASAQCCCEVSWLAALETPSCFGRDICDCRSDASMF